MSLLRPFDSDRFESEAMVHRAALYNFAVRLTRNEAEAEDLVQETYLRAFRFWDKFEPGTNCKAWLFRILRNQFASRYRAGQSKPEEIDYGTLEEQRYETLVDERFAGQAGRPEQALRERDLRAALARALETLPVEYRETILLCLVEGETYQKAADVQGVALGTVMSRVHRGRRLLMSRLVEYAALAGWLSEAQAGHAKSDLAEFQRRRSAD